MILGTQTVALMPATDMSDLPRPPNFSKNSPSSSDKESKTCETGTNYNTAIPSSVCNENTRPASSSFA